MTDNKNIALLIAINDYKGTENDLNGCLNDQSDMEKLLSSKYQIVKMKDSECTVVAVKNKIIDIIHTLKSGDNFIIHYSGHGCFSGNTKIKLLNGEVKTFEELVKDYSNEKFWVYSCKENGEIVPGLAHSPRKTKISRVVKVTLDNNEEIICTPDHKFMLRNGEYKEASKLIENESLMPLYSKLSSLENGDRLDGYELIYIPNDMNLPKRGFYNKEGYYYTHQIVSFYSDYFKNGYKGVIHHCNFNKLNNEPENLKLLTRTEHAKAHSKSEERIEKDRERRVFYNKNIWPKKMEDKEFREKFGKKSSELRKEEWQNDEYREKVSIGLKKSYENTDNTDPRKKALIEHGYKSRMPEAIEKKKETFRNHLLNDEDFAKRKREIGTKNLLKKKNSGNHSRWHKGVKYEDCEICNNYKNHKVKSVEFLNEEIEVYDITVEKYHNFALEAGVFVHNSQVQDKNGDEKDGYDEALYLYDGALIDDDLGYILTNLPDGVTCLVLLDSCFSGTATREIGLKPKFIRLFNVEPHRRKRKSITKNKEMSWCVISGCSENQTSADAYINKRYNGAFTYYLIRAYKQGNTIKEWFLELRRLLPNRKYDQIPTLEGNSKLFDNKIL